MLLSSSRIFQKHFVTVGGGVGGRGENLMPMEANLIEPQHIISRGGPKESVCA